MRNHRVGWMLGGVIFVVMTAGMPAVADGNFDYTSCFAFDPAMVVKDSRDANGIAAARAARSQKIVRAREVAAKKSPADVPVVQSSADGSGRLTFKALGQVVTE